MRRLDQLRVARGVRVIDQHGNRARGTRHDQDTAGTIPATGIRKGQPTATATQVMVFRKGQPMATATQVVVRVTPLILPISSVTRRPMVSRVGPSTVAMKS
jgi:hypothetical protein